MKMRKMKTKKKRKRKRMRMRMSLMMMMRKMFVRHCQHIPAQGREFCCHAVFLV